MNLIVLQQTMLILAQGFLVHWAALCNTWPHVDLMLQGVVFSGACACAEELIVVIAGAIHGGPH